MPYSGMVKDHAVSVVLAAQELCNTLSQRELPDEELHLIHREILWLRAEIDAVTERVEKSDAKA